jgi:hypothetical protein
MGSGENTEVASNHWKQTDFLEVIILPLSVSAHNTSTRYHWFIWLNLISLVLIVKDWNDSTSCHLWRSFRLKLPETRQNFLRLRIEQMQVHKLFFSYVDLIGLRILRVIFDFKPVTVAERSKAWTVFSRSDAGIVGSNTTQGMDVWCIRAFILCFCCRVFT